ncbi:MAG: NifB/NifX family molybdenum-iron cluster-binding protein [Anaerolineales bacterium]
MTEGVKQVAFVIDGEGLIDRHFGRARSYLVLTLENGAVVARETRDKFSPHGSDGGDEHGEPHDHASAHRRMIDPIRDCSVLIAGGMGEPVYRDLKDAGIEPILTRVTRVEAALQAWLSGKLEHDPDLLHRHGGGHVGNQP